MSTFTYEAMEPSPACISYLTLMAQRLHRLPLEGRTAAAIDNIRAQIIDEMKHDAEKLAKMPTRPVFTNPATYKSLGRPL